MQDRAGQEDGRGCDHVHDHAHEHVHEHTHEHAHTHEHDHDHDHAHEQGHEHSHEGHHHGAGRKSLSADERATMLEYLLHHNREHADELRTLSIDGDDSAKLLFGEVIEAYDKANELLGRYLDGERR